MTKTTDHVLKFTLRIFVKAHYHGNLTCQCNQTFLPRTGRGKRSNSHHKVTFSSQVQATPFLVEIVVKFISTARSAASCLPLHTHKIQYVFIPYTSTFRWLCVSGKAWNNRSHTRMQKHQDDSCSTCSVRHLQCYRCYHQSARLWVRVRLGFGQGQQYWWAVLYLQITFLAHFQSMIQRSVDPCFPDTRYFHSSQLAFSMLCPLYLYRILQNPCNTLQP